MNDCSCPNSELHSPALPKSKPGVKMESWDEFRFIHCESEGFITRTN